MEGEENHVVEVNNMVQRSREGGHSAYEPECCSDQRLHSVGFPKMHPSQPPVLLGHRAPFHTYVGTFLPVIFVFRTMWGGIPLIDKKVSELGRRQGPDGGMKGGAAGA